MKTLVVGDLHLKQQFVLPRIDGMLAGDAEIGRVVFLGDACDDWGANEADELNAMELYAKWVREHRGRGMRIDVLLGNHDFCYVRGKRGPGSIMSIMRNLRTILEDALQAKVACAVGPYLCSHAGVTGVWAKRFLADVPADASAIAQRLNEMLVDSSHWGRFGQLSAIAWGLVAAGAFVGRLARYARRCAARRAANCGSFAGRARGELCWRLDGGRSRPPVGMRYYVAHELWCAHRRWVDAACRRAGCNGWVNRVVRLV